MTVGGARRYVEAATLLTTVAASRGEEIARSLGRVPSDTVGLTAGAFPSAVGSFTHRVGSCVASATTGAGNTLRSVADRLGQLRRS
jgi:hypothetical protein